MYLSEGLPAKLDIDQSFIIDSTVIRLASVSARIYSHMKKTGKIGG